MPELEFAVPEVSTLPAEEAVAAAPAPGLADARSLEALDFEAVRALIARHTMTDRATARARTLVPETALVTIREEQAATREMRAIASDATFALPRIVEVGEAVERAARSGTLGPLELRDVGIALAAGDAAVRRIRASDAPVLRARCERARPLPEVAAAIDRAVGERGEVLDRASPALARLRRNAVLAQDEARDRCQSILRSPKYARAIQDAVVTVRDGRFVIPVKAEFSGMLPGVVHDTSASGHTLFVEPLDALDVNNRVRTLRLEEEREVSRILTELSALVGRNAVQAETNLEVLATLDLALARARVAQAMRAVAPLIVDEPRVAIFEGRHPLLGERAVPQSLTLDDDVRFIVISGPNMGGKTVALKMLGLYVIMTYCGLQLPAGEGTTVGAFDYIGCDIGDEQSIADNTSTFSAHLQRLRALVEAAGPRSLVLVDEIAGGTEPAAGAALAISLLEHLLARGAHGVVTTHSTEVKLFAHATQRVRNASVRFDPHTYVPTYHLDVGSPGQSLALPLARSLGLAPSIVARAEGLLSESERDYDRALSELAEIRSAAAGERDALSRERAELVTLEATARGRSESLERERRKLVREAEQRLTLALREFTAELQRRGYERPAARQQRVTAGQTALLGRVLDDVHRDLGLTAKPSPEPVAPKAPKPAIAVGDTVMLESFGSEGTVIDDYGDTLLVAMGSMKTVVPKASVRVVRAPEAPVARSRVRAKSGAATLEAASAARPEIDVRGKRLVEAEPLVDKWLDDAQLVGASPLRLIHGKGTGLLGRGLQQFLRERVGVRSFRYGNADEGGSGVTILELE
ncbi:MAG: endonuclease MutS2 [Vulcanimicrobiaceae bacterium]